MNKQIKNMNTAEDYPFETSKRDLAAEILKQAALDLKRFHGATSAIERELYLDAHRWVMSDDCSWPFSFLSACKLLNRPPEVLREELLGDLSLGVFGCWTRRGGRVARRVQIVFGQLFTNERNANDAQPSALANIAH